MPHILDLPDEILCKIFEYLSLFDVLHSFINLNHRFDRLLTPFKQQIDLTNLSYEEFKYYINILLPILNKDGLLNVIKLGNKRTPGQIKSFNILINNEDYRNYFNNIDRIFVESPRLEEFIEFVDKYILSLKNLEILSINIDYICDKDFQRLTQLIINSIFSITSLVKLSIEMSNGLVLSRLSNTIIFHSLIYVNLNLSLITDLLILIQHIPNVENLYICISWWTSGDRTIIKMLDEMNTNNQHSFLNRLKKFRLIINSIITFQFEHLEQIFYKIINDKITSSFNLILRNNLIRNNESMNLINGQQWERLLKLYPLLIQFNLFIRISGSIENEDEINKLNSFNSKFFQQKKWIFSYLKYPARTNSIFYSIPYRNKELFDIIIDNNIILKNFPINYTSLLSIDHIDDPLIFNKILKYFPCLQELNLNYINTNSSVIQSFNIPSLHTLKIEKESNINLFNLIQLFPLINTLVLTYFNTNDQYKSLENVYQYNRIIQLCISGISEVNLNQILLFLNQFPNLRFLLIHIQNRRISDEILLRYLNEIIQQCQLLVNLKIQLEKDIESSINMNDQLNIRTKMRFTDVIFDGVLIHLWF